MFLLGALLLGMGCRSIEGPQLTTTLAATVKHTALEGGFYYLHGDDGADYDPTNLGADYQQDGKRVNVKLKIRDDLASAHSFGIMVDVLSISAIP
jgi:hypothetical protein